MIRQVAGVICAALRYNELDAAQGYDAFDLDEDGVVSLRDLEDAAVGS